MSERVKRPVAACLACLLSLAVVASLAYRTGSFQRLDARILQRLAAYREAQLGSLAKLLAHLADPPAQVALAGVVCLLALCCGRRRQGLAAIVLIVGADLTTQVLKGVLAQSRYQPLLGYYQVGSTAFPSGHATAVTAMALAFALVVPRSWRALTVAIGACLAVAIGGSVVVLHRHYPSDVLGGVLVAAAWFFAVVAALRLCGESSLGGRRPGAATRPPAACASSAAAAGRRGR